MNEDFIQIKYLEGELKISHKKRDYGLTISTKEFVLHKPHINYIVKLANIVSIIPFDARTLKTIRFESQRSRSREVTESYGQGQHYKIHVASAVVHNRSGLYEMGQMDFIIPIHDRLLQAISRYSGLIVI